MERMTEDEREMHRTLSKILSQRSGLTKGSSVRLVKIRAETIKIGSHHIYSTPRALSNLSVAFPNFVTERMVKRSRSRKKFAIVNESKYNFMLQARDKGRLFAAPFFMYTKK